MPLTPRPSHLAPRRRAPRAPWRALLGCALCAALLLVGAPPARADDAPPDDLPPSLIYLPTDPVTLTLVPLPDAAARAAMLAALEAAPPSAPLPAQARRAYLREQLAWLEATAALIAARDAAPDPRPDAGPPPAAPPRSRADSLPLLTSAASRPGADALTHGLLGVALIEAQPRSPEAADALQRALASPPDDVDVRGALALADSARRLRMGDPQGAAERLLELPYSPVYQGLILHTLAGIARDADNDALLERRQLALIAHLRTQDRLAEVAPPLLEASFDDLARAGATRAGGWERLTEALRQVEDDALRERLARAALDAYAEVRASGLHRASLHLFLFEQWSDHAAAIAHLEAGVDALDDAPPEARDAYCERLTSQLRSTRPWWVAFGEQAALRGRAEQVLGRCLRAQLEHHLARGDERAAFARYEAMAVDHVEVFEPSDHARYAVLLHERGMTGLAYDHLRALDVAALDDRALRQRVARVIGEVFHDAHRALQLDRQRCSAQRSTPPTRAQRALSAALDLSLEVDGLTPDARTRLLTMRAALALSRGDYLAAVDVFVEALTAHPDPATALAAALTRVVDCLAAGEQWSQLTRLSQRAHAALPRAARGALRETLRGDAVIEAHMRWSWALHLTGRSADGAALLEDLQARWLADDLPDALLFRTAELLAAAGRDDDALLHYTNLFASGRQSELADDAMFAVAMLLEARGELAQAREVLRALVAHGRGEFTQRASIELEALDATLGVTTE